MTALTILRYVLVAIFVGSGASKLAGVGFVREEFVKWDYPDWFRIAVGVYELIGAALLLMPETVSAGVWWLVLLMLGAIYTHLKAKGQMPRVVLPIAVLAMLLLVYFKG